MGSLPLFPTTTSPVLQCITCTASPLESAWTSCLMTWFNTSNISFSAESSCSNGCGRQFVTAIRYRCTVCKDYDLCSPCYNHNVHDLTHPFMQISKLRGVNLKPSYIRLYPHSIFQAPTPSSNTPPTTTIPAT